MQYRILVVLEKAPNNYSAYAPDVPGCVSTGKTVEETLDRMREALQMQLEGTLEDGDPIPEITAVEACFVDVDVSVPAEAIAK